MSTPQNPTPDSQRRRLHNARQSYKSLRTRRRKLQARINAARAELAQLEPLLSKVEQQMEATRALRDQLDLLEQAEMRGAKSGGKPCEATPSVWRNNGASSAT